MLRQQIKVILLSILVFSITLTACQAVERPSTTGVNSELTPDEGKSPTLSVTPAPSKTPTLAPTATSSPTLKPTPDVTQPWTEIGFAQTPLPDLTGPITSDNFERITQIAVWGKGSANGIDLSPDGQVLAVETDLGAFFYDSLSYMQLALFPTSLPVMDIAFSPDNWQIAVGLSDGSVEIINRGNYTSLAILASPVPDFTGIDNLTLSFSPDGGELYEVIEVAEEIHIHRWNTNSWQTIADFSLDSGWTAYSSASLDLIGIIKEEKLTLQSLTFPEEKDILTLPESIAPSFWNRMVLEGGEVAASSNGDFILISNGIAIARWDLLEDRYTYLLDDYPSHLPDPCSLAPDTCLNASGGLSWACGDGNTLDPIEHIILTPDNVMVLISRNDRLTEFRHAYNNLMLWEIEAAFTDVAFSPGGEYFYGLRPDGAIERRATLDGTLLDFIEMHPSQLFSMAFSIGNHVLAAGFSDGWVRVFSAANGEMLGVLNGIARSLQFSPDGSLLAAGLDDGTVRIFVLEEGRFYDISPGHLAAVTDLVFSETGELLLTGSADCTTSLWNVADRYRIRTSIPSNETPFRVSQALLGRDEQTEFVSGNRTGVTAFTRPNAETVLLPELTIRDLSLSPDGTRMAVAGEGLYLFSLVNDLVSGFVSLDAGRTGESYTAAFDPSGTLLADATLTGIRLWTVDDATFLIALPVSAFISPDNPPVTLAFSPDGSIIALAAADGLIQIFGIPNVAGE